MPLFQCTTKAIPGVAYRLDTITDFSECADVLMDINYHGSIKFGKDIGGNETLVMDASNTGSPIVGVNAVSATIGNVLRWDGAQLKKYEDQAAFLTENDVT